MADSKTFDFGDGEISDVRLRDIDSTADQVMSGGGVRGFDAERVAHRPLRPEPRSDSGWNWAAIGAVLTALGIVAAIVIAVFMT